MKKFLPTIIGLFISITVFSETNDTIQLEVPSLCTRIYTLDDGLIVLKTNDCKKTIDKVIERYDTNFNLIKKIDFKLDNKDFWWSPSEIFRLNDNYYFYYSNGNSKFFQIVTYNLKTNDIKISPIGNIHKNSDRQFVVLGDNAFIAYNSLGAMHYKANLIIFNINTGKTEIPELLSKTRTLYPIKTLSYNNSLNEVNLVFQSSLDENSKLEIIRYDSTGNKIYPPLLIQEPTNDYHPTSIDLSHLNKNNFLISGQSLQESQKGVPILTVVNFKKGKKQSLFLSSYENNKMQWIKYINYKELESIKSVIKNDDEILFNTPIIINSEIYFIGEIFYPVYADRTIYADGTTGQNSLPSIDYYLYKYATILCLEIETGDLKWDKTIPTYVELKELKSTYKLSKSEDKLALIIQDNNDIKKVVFEHNGDINYKNLSQLSNKKQYKEDVRLLENWYNDKIIEVIKTNYKDSKIVDKFTIRRY